MTTKLDVKNEIKVSQAMPASRITSATATNGTSIDTRGLSGRAIFMIDTNHIGGTSPTADWKVQDAPEGATADTAGTFADVAGLTLAQVTTTDGYASITVDLDGSSIRRFIRLVCTTGGTSPEYVIAATLIAGAISKPVTNS